jgi:hypothetical protein
MRLTSFLSHHRLLVNFLALAVALGALALAPAANAQKYICDTGCVAWDAQNGCTEYMTCCVASPDDWTCVQWSPQNQ